MRRPKRAGLASVEYVTGAGVAYYRLTLPVVIDGHGTAIGTWNAVLSLDDVGYKRYLATLGKDPALLKEVKTHGVRYSVSVHSLSSLRMDARVIQSSYEPGATMTVRAVLTEYGLPVDHRATADIDIERPDHSHHALALTEIEPGVFEKSTVATLPGVYRMYVRARGATARSKPFTREQLLTGAVWKGGDQPPPTGATDPHARDEQLCRLLECLFGSKAFDKLLARNDVDSKLVRDCLARFCAERAARASEAPPPSAKGSVRGASAPPSKPSA